MNNKDQDIWWLNEAPADIYIVGPTELKDLAALYKLDWPSMSAKTRIAKARGALTHLSWGRKVLYREAVTNLEHQIKRLTSLGIYIEVVIRYEPMQDPAVCVPLAAAGEP